jgi:hypothetical protein
MDTGVLVLVADVALRNSGVGRHSRFEHAGI